MIDELPEGPDPANDTPQSFSQKAAAMVLAQRAMVPQINQAVAEMNALQAGGAYALPYVFDTATTDADPGAGKLRLSSATQSAATVMRLDLTAGGQDYTTLIDTMDGSTSIIKGSIRLVKQGDLSKWMTFDVTARAAPTGYRNLTVVCTDSSLASPFAAGDALMLFFQRNGDRGQQGASGVLMLASATVTTAVANIDFLNIFNADYDKYTIELQGLNTANGNGTIALRLAIAQTVVVSSNYPMGSPAGSSGTGTLVHISSSVTGAGPFSIEIRNVNSATGICGIGVRGLGSDGAGNYYPAAYEGALTAPGVKTGFRIFTSGLFNAGTVRVFGHRNS